MTAFFVCLNAVVPIFLIMALGCLARHLGAIKREDVPKFNRLLFRYFMPVMLFYNIYTSDLSGAVQPKLLIFAAAGDGARPRCGRRPGRRAYLCCRSDVQRHRSDNA